MSVPTAERDTFGGIAGAVDVDKVLYPSRERLTWVRRILDGSYPISDVDRAGFREGLISKQTPRFFQPRSPDLLSEKGGETWYCADPVGFQRMVQQVEQLPDENVDRAIRVAARKLVAQEEAK